MLRTSQKGRSLKIGIGVSPPDTLTPNGVTDLVAYAVLADRLGFERFAVPEHMLITPRLEGKLAAAFPFPLDSLWPDPFVLLAAVAGATRSIRLVTAIAIAPLRPAINLAKAAATLDAVSGGRLELGLGIGWMPDELEAAGARMDQRLTWLEDSIGACRALWTQSPATFASSTVSFRNAYCRPLPVQPGGPPILLAGTASSRFVDRVAALADGWIPQAGPDTWSRDSQTEEVLAEGTSLLGAAFARAGRNPDSLIIHVSAGAMRDGAGRPEIEASLDRIAALREVGATHVALRLSWWVDRPEQVKPFLERVAARFF
jgi:probable F420-dependent oxidoreductase